MTKKKKKVEKPCFKAKFPNQCTEIKGMGNRCAEY